MYLSVVNNYRDGPRTRIKPQKAQIPRAEKDEVLSSANISNFHLVCSSMDAQCDISIDDFAYTQAVKQDRNQKRNKFREGYNISKAETQQTQACDYQSTLETLRISQIQTMKVHVSSKNNYLQQSTSAQIKALISNNNEGLTKKKLLNTQIIVNKPPLKRDKSIFDQIYCEAWKSPMINKQKSANNLVSTYQRNQLKTNTKPLDFDNQISNQFVVTSDQIELSKARSTSMYDTNTAQKSHNNYQANKNFKFDESLYIDDSFHEQQSFDQEHEADNQLQQEPFDIIINRISLDNNIGNFKSTTQLCQATIDQKFYSQNTVGKKDPSLKNQSQIMTQKQENLEKRIQNVRDKRQSIKNQTTLKFNEYDDKARKTFTTNKERERSNDGSFVQQDGDDRNKSPNKSCKSFVTLHNYERKKNSHSNQWQKNEESLPCLKGWLKKQSNALFKKWNSKYVVLDNKTLKIYADDNCLKLENQINFDKQEFSVKVQKKSNPRQFKIELLVDQKTPKKQSLEFEAANPQDLQRWTDAIQIQKQSSYQSSNNQLSLSEITPAFLSEPKRISHLKFEEIVDTGDILLFETKNVGAKLTRIFTRSSFDHVALMLRYTTGRVVLFESLRDQGVGICDWSTFLNQKWNDLYHRVVLRKLNYPREPEFLSGIEDFVQQTLGKPFKINPSKLLRKSNANDTAQKIKVNKSFFCSELVATAYKRLGILDKTIAASKYWPGDFSMENQNKEIRLCNGASLGEELLIEFII